MDRRIHRKVEERFMRDRHQIRIPVAVVLATFLLACGEKVEQPPPAIRPGRGGSFGRFSAPGQQQGNYRPGHQRGLRGGDVVTGKGE